MCVKATRVVGSQKLVFNAFLYLLSDVVFVEELDLVFGGVDVDVNVHGVDLKTEVDERMGVSRKIVLITCFDAFL